MHTIYTFFTLFVIFITFSSCKPIQPLTVSKVESVKLNGFSRSAASVLVTMKVKNPNNLRFKIKDKNLILSLNKSEVGNATIKDKIVIKRKSEESYTFEIEADFSKLAITALPSLISIAKSRNAEIHLKGDVRVKTLGIGKTYPIDIVERVGK